MFDVMLDMLTILHYMYGHENTNVTWTNKVIFSANTT